MRPLDLALRAAAAPAAVALLAAVAARWAGGRGRRPVPRDLVVAAGVAGGFLLGAALAGIDVGWWPRPSDDGWKGVLVAARAGLLVGLAAPFVHVPPAPALVLRWAVATGAVLLVLHPLVPHSVSAAAARIRAVAWGAGAAVLWTALAAAARRDARVRSAVPLLLALAASSVLLFQGGRSLTMATAATALGSATAATAAIAPWRGGPPVPGAAVPALVLAFVALLAAGEGYLTYDGVSRLPALGGALLLAAASGGLVPSTRWAIALSLVLASSAAAVVLV